MRAAWGVDVARCRLSADVLDSESKMLAKLVGVFKFSRSLQVEMSTAGNSMIRATFEGKAGGEAPVSMPDTFSMYLPFFGNITDKAIHAPCQLWKFSLRIIPPKGDGQPVFRVRWVNGDQVVQEAMEALHKAVRAAVPESWQVFHGKPDHVRYEE
jgi:hypothetical protein